MVRLALLLALSLATASDPVASNPQGVDDPVPAAAPAGADACDLAVAALVSLQLDEGEGAVAVSDEVGGPSLAGETLAGAKSSQPGPKGPSLAMANAYLAARPISAVTACPKVRAYLDSVKVGYGADGVRKAQQDGAGDLLGAMIIQLSLPVLSPDGREAILDMSYVFQRSRGGGGGKTYYWREPAGAWHAGELEQWLS